MRVSSNPGRWVEAVAELELVSGAVVDVETGEPVELVSLLESFREDPSRPELGEVRITVELASTFWERPRLGWSS